jgi:hypothetical protein
MRVDTKNEPLFISKSDHEETIERFKKRMQEGYYSSEKIAESISEKLALAFDAELERSL